MDDKTLHALTLLADKLGVAVEFIWTALIKQAYISGLFNLFLIATMSIGIAWLSKIVYGRDKNDEIRIALFFAWLLFAVLSPILFYDSVTALANPEYWALKKVWK